MDINTIMSYYVIRYLDLRLMNSKNKQYKIAKGLLLSLSLGHHISMEKLD